MIQTDDDLRTLNVLILEEREADAQRVLAELEKSGYSVSHRRAYVEAEFLRALQEDSFDLILSEYNLYNYTAWSALLRILEQNLDIPFIVVTEGLEDEQVAALMKQGAADYITKDWLGRLGGAVAAALEQRRLRIEKDLALMRLSESEERFRRIAENVPDVLYRLRTYPDLAYDFLSPAVEQVLGYAPEDFYQDFNFIFQVVHPDDRELLVEQFQSPLVSTDTYVLRWIHRDGRVVWTEQRNMQVYNDRHDLIAVEGIARDITERVEREREQEAILSVVSALRDAMTRGEIVLVVVEKVARLLNADRVALSAVDLDDGSLLVEAAVGDWKPWEGRPLVLGRESLHRVLAERKPVIHQMDEDSIPVSTGWLGCAGWCACQ